MSARAAYNPETPTLPARAPDGIWLSHPRYRWYILFAATGFILAAICIELLFAFAALGRGYAAWSSFLAVMSSPPMLLLNGLLWISLLFFSLRFLRVGVKIPTVQLGPIPGPPAPVILVAHFGGLIVVSLALLVILSGAVL
jgi:fumarate reductase subunit C